MLFPKKRTHCISGKLFKYFGLIMLAINNFAHLYGLLSIYGSVMDKTDFETLYISWYPYIHNEGLIYSKIIQKTSRLQLCIF